MPLCGPRARRESAVAGLIAVGLRMVVFRASRVGRVLLLAVLLGVLVALLLNLCGLGRRGNRR